MMRRHGSEVKKTVLTVVGEGVFIFCGRYRLLPLCSWIYGRGNVFLFAGILSIKLYFYLDP